MNRYLVTAPRPVLDHDPGSEFDHELTASEEAELVSSGRLQIVPRRYRVVGTSRVSGTEPGSTFLGRYTVDQEAALLGGHIERIDSHTPAVKAPKPDAKPAAGIDKSKE